MTGFFFKVKADFPLSAKSAKYLALKRTNVTKVIENPWVLEGMRVCAEWSLQDYLFLFS